jgi:hypothetical protein
MGRVTRLNVWRSGRENGGVRRVELDVEEVELELKMEMENETGMRQSRCSTQLESRPESGERMDAGSQV